MTSHSDLVYLSLYSNFEFSSSIFQATDYHSVPTSLHSFIIFVLIDVYRRTGIEKLIRKGDG